MKKLLLTLFALVIVAGVGAAVFAAVTTGPAPSSPTERVIPNDHFPQ